MLQAWIFAHQRPSRHLMPATRPFRHATPALTGAFLPALRQRGSIAAQSAQPGFPSGRTVRSGPSAAAAEQAGFRACLRCRPEAAPGTPAAQGSAATVSRALRLIGEGALDTGSVCQLADRLGLGERQVRRLFNMHLGANPEAVAATRRLLLANQLLRDTNLPVADIAFASGFSSLRRFNDAFAKRYGEPPTAIRRAARKKGHGATNKDNGAAVRPSVTPWVSTALRLADDLGLFRDSGHSRGRGD